MPFPGKIEPSLPEPIHKPFEDMEKTERIFDTKEVSRQEHKTKIIVESKMNDNIVPLGILSKDHPLLQPPWMQ